MLSLSRYRALVVVVVGLAVSVLLVDAALTACVGAVSRWLLNGESPADTKVGKVIGGILAGIVAGPNPVGIGTDTPLGIVLGQSTAGSAVDPRVLEEHDGVAMRWLNLHGWGGSILRMKPQADQVLLSGLKPNVVVFCINPYMFIGHNYEIENVPSGRGSLVVKLKPWVWTYNNRSLVNQFFRQFATEVRTALFQAFGLRIHSLYAPDPRPWERPGPTGALADDTPFTAAEFNHQYEHERRLGWFDPGRYSPDSLAARTLADLIGQFRDRGSRVCLVLMPEHSLLRTKIPPEAVKCFDQINEKYFHDDPVPIFNLRDQCPDDFFKDLDHCLGSKRAPISALIAKTLHPALAPEK